MLEGIKNCSEAMLALQTNLETVANNIANANTAGFKQDVGIVFSSAYNSALANAGYLQAGGNTQPLGDDLSYASMVKFKSGSAKKTDNPANLFIGDETGSNFFTLKIEDGILFTRNGNFHFNSEGYLVTSEGLKVLGEKGPIKADGSSFEVKPDGRVFVDDKEVDKLLITSFKDTRYLKKVGDNNFQADTRSGAYKSSKYGIAQGHIETSNVNVLMEMVEMMNIMRTFEANQKILQTADQNLQTTNRIGKLGA